MQTQLETRIIIALKFLSAYLFLVYLKGFISEPTTRIDEIIAIAIKAFEFLLVAVSVLACWTLEE
jgi:hypothetical protein